MNKDAEDAELRPMEWNVGDLVRKLREFHKLSQGELAARAKVNVSTVVAIEKGRNYEAKSLDLVANALGYGAGSDLLSLVPPSVTSRDTLPGETAPLGEDEAKALEGAPVRDDFGGLRLRWDRIPADQRLDALRVLEQTLDSFLEGGVRPAHHAARDRATKAR
jgi:transcriptional regulator with XRE-family HTH domain